MSRDLFELRWDANLHRDVEGTPLLPPLFVAEQGPAVHLVDVRPATAARDVIGYIPGSVFMPLDRLASAGPDLPLVLVSATGATAAAAARQLEAEGLTRVAAMAGGLAAWRRLGLKTSRPPAGAAEAVGVAGVPEELYRAAKDDPSAGTLSLEEVSDHIGDPRTVRWIKMPALVLHGRSACVDGRDERGVVGTPGGDAGEFVLALAALETATGATLDEDSVAAALQSHIDRFGEFYMHTDAHAFAALVAAIRADARTKDLVADVSTDLDWIGFLHAPPEPVREVLLELLVNPAHVGCGHLRLMLQHGDEYGLRSELVASVVRSVFRLWWAGLPEVQMTLLPGDHGEGAVVNVRVDEDFWGMSWVPLISPACGGTQMFVNHPQVSAKLREVVIEFHLRGHGPVPVRDEEAEFRAAFGELAARQLGVTLGYLANGLPVYEVNFRGDRSFTVHNA